MDCISKDGPKLLPTENRLVDTGAGGGGEGRRGWDAWRGSHARPCVG